MNLDQALDTIIANKALRTYKKLPPAEQKERDEQIIVMYAEGKSYGQIANVLDISRMRVCQIVQQYIKEHQAKQTNVT